jgi:hypothetical protein
MFDQFVADFLDPIFFPRWFRMKKQLPATFDHGSKRRLSGFDFTALNDWNWGAKPTWPEPQGALAPRTSCSAPHVDPTSSWRRWGVRYLN